MTTPLPVILSCAGCATELAPTMTTCPGCGRLVHADTLAQLAATARAASDRGDIPAALAAWREALELLPPASRQYQVIAAKITELGRLLPADGSPSSARKPSNDGSIRSRVAGGLAAIGVAGWKLKALLLGLAKGTTLLSMLASLGIYSTAYSWQLVLGMILSIYVHEMGHVIALQKYGIKASAPMFIPGLGAFVRFKQGVTNPLQDADIGLAGPVYGLGAAVLSLLIWYATHLSVFAAVAGVGAWINLGNLTPVWQLDGSRAFQALSRVEQAVMSAVAGACWCVTRDWMLLVVGVVCLVRVLSAAPDLRGSRKTAVTFTALVLALEAIATFRRYAGISI